MDIVDVATIIAVCVMIVVPVVAYFRKLMMLYALIIANVVVFFITLVVSESVYNLGFVPVYLLPENTLNLYTLFTCMFVHGGFFHLFGNMLVFFFIGMAFEERVGWKKFLVVYLLAGVCGTLTHSIVNLGTQHMGTLLVGASGAIFGVMGAMAFSYPRDEVVMPIPLGFFMILRRIKVIYAVLIFAVIETVVVILDVQDATAHFAHIGGLIGGAVLAAIFIRGVKTHTKEGRTIYYDPYSPQKSRGINFSHLKELATTSELKDMLKKIENETIPQAQDIWLAHFLEKTKCPRCGKPLNHFDKRIWCEDCGFKTSY